MKRIAFTLVAVALVVMALVAAACGQGAATPSPAPSPAPAATPVPTTVATPQGTAKPPTPAPVATVMSTPQDKWTTTLAEARKEGKVALYALWTSDVRQALTTAFKDKYGIDLEYSPFSRGADLLAKIQAEKRAGLRVADVFGAGNPSLVTSMKPEGVLGQIQPLLILPEVTAPAGWQNGKLPYADNDGKALSLIAVVQRSIVYNKDMVKDGEITGFKDLLKPQYKGKINFNDPSVTGTGNAVLTHLGNNLWSEAEARDWFTRLVKEQGLVIERDQRIQMEGVARGKYAIGLAPQQANLAEFMALGAPIKLAIIDDDNRVTAGAGALGVADQLAHPNAAAVFVNWLLSKEGMTVLSKSFGNPTTRVDVPTAGIDPVFVPVPGKSYLGETEEVLNARVKWLDIAKKIMEEAR